MSRLSAAFPDRFTGNAGFSVVRAGSDRRRFSDWRDDERQDRLLAELEAAHGKIAQTPKDLTGRVIGLLTIIGRWPASRRWLCRCACNRLVILPPHKITSDYQKISCGCQDGHNLRKIEGKRFGRLRALCAAGRQGHWRMWEFKCDCGRVCTRRAADVMRGVRPYCPHCPLPRPTVRVRGPKSIRKLQMHMARPSIYVDIKRGEEFGRLRVTGPVPAHRAPTGARLWRCRCQCGGAIWASTVQLRRKRGGVRSCGCLAREQRQALARKRWAKRAAARG